ncbi:uncharacterized protein LOC132713001 isoform X2 [Ruditapes philippinarum]|uniref:uncharacterized protein LOC132713001 isoform X2 n=1 Tax=Ruditapes philippinarum TaxID=129788 RepID=UPI00295B6852|nr:uncharacterized protein LOC132713001 isoform X2 [Ruditapes philippinarum]
MLLFAVLSIYLKLTVAAVTCPNGDTAGIIKDGMTCSELVADDNAECYDTSIEATCCASCNAVARNNQNCLYGDKAVCFSFLCPTYTDINTCCETCASSITTQSTTSTSTAASMTSSSTSDENTDGHSDSNGSSNDNGVIAGAVVGSIAGITFLVVGAFIAMKILKKKDNQIGDDASSGIPEKIDRNSSGYIPEKADICTVLQEKLDTSCDLIEKQQLPVEKGHDEGQSDDFVKTYNNDNNDVNRIIQTSTIEKPITKGVCPMNATNGAKNGDDVDMKRKCLSPLQESNVEATPIHDILPPIGTSVSCRFAS